MDVDELIAVVFFFYCYLTDLSCMLEFTYLLSHFVLLNGRESWHLLEITLSSLLF